MEELINRLTDIQKEQLEVYSHDTEKATIIKDWRTVAEIEIRMDAYLTALMHIGQFSYLQIQRIQAYYLTEDRSNNDE